MRAFIQHMKPQTWHNCWVHVVFYLQRIQRIISGLGVWCPWKDFDLILIFLTVCTSSIFSVVHSGNSAQVSARVWIKACKWKKKHNSHNLLEVFLLKPSKRDFWSLIYNFNRFIYLKIKLQGNMQLCSEFCILLHHKIEEQIEKLHLRDILVRFCFGGVLFLFKQENVTEEVTFLWIPLPFNCSRT